MHQVGRLHLITDTQTQRQWTHLQLVQKAVDAGATTIQYREKAFSLDRHGAELCEIASLCRKHHVQLIINDWVEVAVEVSAIGVHLGETDMPLEKAVRQLPAFMLIGATVHSLAYYERIRHLPLAYVGVGPVYESPTKPGARAPIGVEGLRRLVESILHPVVAIGGITAERAKQLFEAIPKLHGVAVVSAFAQAPDPEKAVRELLAVVPPVT